MNIRTLGTAIHSSKALMTVCVSKGDREFTMSSSWEGEIELGKSSTSHWGNHCHNLDKFEGISMSWRKVTLEKEINTSQRQKSMIVVDCDEKGAESQLDWSKIRYHIHLKIQHSQHHRLWAIFLIWMFIKQKITRIVLKKYNFCVN